MDFWGEKGKKPDLFIDDESFGWSNEFVAYSAPADDSAEGRGEDKKQHQQ